ncbi:MAG: hypothetical protein NC914_03705, partial [Candidatus Omnitrophica bacterium]|nr:hypothetical protein [Candidatus Omnitrophota bacterium]
MATIALNNVLRKLLLVCLSAPSSFDVAEGTVFFPNPLKLCRGEDVLSFGPTSTKEKPLLAFNLLPNGLLETSET